VSELFKEVLSIVECEVRWLEHAAQPYELFGGERRDAEKPAWDLLAAVYRDRARFHQALAAKMRGQIQLTPPDIFGERR
jgi:hypothetical protein